MQPFLRKGRMLLLWTLAALVESGVAIPWMILLYAGTGDGDWPASLPGAWLLIAVYLAAAGWEAGAPGGREEGSPSRRITPLLVGILGAYVAAYLALPGDAHFFSMNAATAIIPISAYLWYSGTRTASEGLEHGFIIGRFTRQALLTVGGVLLLRMIGVTQDSRVLVLLYWSVLLLFTSGLLLLIATRERALRADQAEMGETDAAASTSPWMIGFVGALVLVTLGASYLVSVDRLMTALEVVGSPLLAVWRWLVDILMLLLYRWMLILWVLVSPIFYLFRLLRGEQPPEPTVPTDPGSQELPTEYGPGFLDVVLDYMRFNGMVLFIILACIAVYGLYRRRKERRESEVEERVSLGFWANLTADLQGLLGLLRPRASVGSVAEAGEHLAPDDPRALFRRLQAWGALVGRPRRPAETPTTFSTALGDRRPEAAGAAAVITDVYNQARYGPGAPEPAAVEAAVKAARELVDPQP